MTEAYDGREREFNHDDLGEVEARGHGADLDSVDVAGLMIEWRSQCAWTAEIERENDKLRAANTLLAQRIATMENPPIISTTSYTAGADDTEPSAIEQRCDTRTT